MDSKAPKQEAADYETWRRADLWTIERAILLLLNAETLPGNNYYSSGRCKTPNEQAIYDDFMKIWAIAESSLKTGILKKVGKGYPNLLSEILPSDFICWAKLKGYPIPDELKTIGTATQTEAVGDAGTGSNAGTETKPRDGGYKLRDEFAIEQVKDWPELLEMRAGMIKVELQNASNLFTSGYDEWWRKNPVFNKSKPGRNPKSN
ncbi:MAG: hypothetical protein WCP96_14185 [Methylococcaceae bacterium]